MDIALTDTERPTRTSTTAAGPIATAPALTRRDRAILKAVAAGRAELVLGAEPDLLLDGRCCCDQVAAHRLARAGLIAPLAPAAPGTRVPAALTAAGTAELAG
jgi:hypothetical protein